MVSVIVQPLIPFDACKEQSFSKTAKSGSVGQRVVSVSPAPVESVRQSRSLWRITNECVNCLLLATLVGMRSLGRRGYTHTDNPLLSSDRSVSSLVLFWRGEIRSIGASFLDDDKDARTQWDHVLFVCYVVEMDTRDDFSRPRRSRGDRWMDSCPEMYYFLFRGSWLQAQNFVKELSLGYEWSTCRVWNHRNSCKIRETQEIFVSSVNRFCWRAQLIPVSTQK